MPAHCEKSGIFQFSFFTKYEQTTVTKYCVSTSSKSEFAKFNYKGHVHAQCSVKLQKSGAGACG